MNNASEAKYDFVLKTRSEPLDDTTSNEHTRFRQLLTIMCEREPRGVIGGHACMVAAASFGYVAGAWA